MQKRSHSTIAIVGNPNVGKSTLFNALTGLSQITGNYPGVTVERKVGKLRLREGAAHIIDLPGAYSLAARSPDEMIVADVLLGQQAGENPIDCVLVVVDATNLERNLYLVSQLCEFDIPIVVALNMMDLAERAQVFIDLDAFQRELGVPVVPVQANKNAGIARLKDVLEETLRAGRRSRKPGPVYPPDLASELDGLLDALHRHALQLGRRIPRIEAFRILVDQGGHAEKRVIRALDGALQSELTLRRSRLGAAGALSAIEARCRYAWIRGIIAASVQKPARHAVTFSDRLDKALTNRFTGGIIFLALMAGVFQAIYNGAAPVMFVIDRTFAAISQFVSSWLPSGAMNSLIVDGVIAGVGSVLIFLPQILILSLFIALLEDCGYMARAAFIMDRLFSKCGLSGQCFIPLLSSFACAIPGIMATRIIPERRDRITTILVAPLMSCSARLPVYTVLIAAFIPNTPLVGGLMGLQGVTLLGLYLLGIAVAAPTAWLLKRTLLRGETPPFLLELPAYKTPQLRTVLLRVWSQGLEFLLRAGTVICAISIIVWALGYFPRSSEVRDKYDAMRMSAAALPTADEREAVLARLDRAENSEHLHNSYFARMGHAIEPFVRPLGWDWRIGMATLASFPAREVIVSTLGTLFNLSDDAEETGFLDSLRRAQRTGGAPLFTVPVALSIMVFFALCCQCGATLVMIYRETKTWRWPTFAFVYMTALAYAGAWIIYRIALAAGWGG
ncbi:MAG TPA: ferrous iron transport protein B [Candidatus Hydrogenedentes bacterium]|nr:ferrous iron transport protein B [Candidatus Hydrogenedentota bacterium]HOS03773.1 ferrous iron transport protein B [Candidatus Hydrogenedentota bacterium]